MNDLDKILHAVGRGEISPAVAAERLREGEVRYVEGFAALDLGRTERKGVPEVVYARAKSPEQVAKICTAVLQSLVRGDGEPAPTGGRIGALSAGTSDLPILEEALAVAHEMGVEALAFHDVGVAGVHRLFGPLQQLRDFDPDCIVVAAGMEGALPSVVSGLVSAPVIGLPTSTGYGLGGDGTAAILGMLQTCSPGLTVVNVDNGVGAGATAALIANRAATARKPP
jgi:NCAIR mutase (PurE)-related protein